MEDCTFSLQSECHKLSYTKKKGLRVPTENEKDILCQRTGIDPSAIKDICLHHEEVLLKRFTWNQKGCCNPFAVHKTAKRHRKLRVITSNLYEKMKDQVPQAIPGKKLCVDCYVKASRVSADLVDKSSERPSSDIEDQDISVVEVNTLLASLEETPVKKSTLPSKKQLKKDAVPCKFSWTSPTSIPKSKRQKLLENKAGKDENQNEESIENFSLIAPKLEPEVQLYIGDEIVQENPSSPSVECQDPTETILPHVPQLQPGVQLYIADQLAQNSSLSNECQSGEGTAENVPLIVPKLEPVDELCSDDEHSKDNCLSPECQSGEETAENVPLIVPKLEPVDEICSDDESHELDSQIDIDFESSLQEHDPVKSEIADDDMDFQSSDVKFEPGEITNLVRQTNITSSPCGTKSVVNETKCSCKAGAGGNCKHSDVTCLRNKTEGTTSKTSTERELRKSSEKLQSKYCKGMKIADMFPSNDVLQGEKVEPVDLESLYSQISKINCPLAAILKYELKKTV